MSELDDELEDLEPSSGIATDDSFDDPKQTTTALTMEINKLRQKNEVLRQFNVRQKDKYKHEVRSFLTPVIEKYKDIRSENEFLRNQIKEMSQKIASSPLLIKSDDVSGADSSALEILQNAYNEKEKEVSVLNKMVKNMEEEVHNAKKNVAEIPALRDLLKQREEQIRKLEQEKFDLNSRVEAKDKSVDKYLKQINELETNLYVANKKLTEGSTGSALAGAAVGALAGAAGMGAMDHAKVAEYEEKLRRANEKASQLENRVSELENQISEYQETMDSLEQELHEDNFMNGNGHNEEESHEQDFSQEEQQGEYDFEGELPSDEDLLADDIELDELPLDEEMMEELPVEDDAPVHVQEAHKASFNFEKSAPVVEEEAVLDEDDILGDFDLSMDSLDEDRDTLDKKK